MNFRKHRNEDPEINLIPFIDVLLVVLIFLMMSTTYSKFTELQVNLPTAEADKPRDRPAEILVEGTGAAVLEVQECNAIAHADQVVRTHVAVDEESPAVGLAVAFVPDGNGFRHGVALLDATQPLGKARELVLLGRWRAVGKRGRSMQARQQRPGRSKRLLQTRRGERQRHQRLAHERPVESASFDCGAQHEGGIRRHSNDRRATVLRAGSDCRLDRCRAETFPRDGLKVVDAKKLQKPAEAA